MKTSGLLLIAACCGALASASVAQKSITTTFASNNGGASTWVNMYDVKVKASKGILFTELDVNTSASVGSPVTLDIYTCAATHVGNQLNPGVWTKVSTGTGVSAGQDAPSRVDIADFQLAPGTHGFAIHYTNIAPRYTNGNGANQTVTNVDLDLNLGISVAGLFTGSVFNPRVCNVTMHYGATGQAAVSKFGSGCKGSNGIPSLDGSAGSLPKLGSALSMEFTNMPLPGSTVFVLVGFSNQKMSSGIALPFDMGALGAPGCMVQVDPLATGGAGAVNGTAKFIMPVPNDPNLSGIPVFFQGIVLDPGFNVLNLTATNGLTAWLGT